MTDDVQVITMPKLGETVTEGTVGAWLKSVGDTVAFDEPLFEVSTDKIDSEIPSPYDGVLLEVLVADGETVPVGTELARIGPASAAGADPAAGADSAAGAASAAGPDSAAAATSPPPSAPSSPAASAAAHEITMPKLGETVTEGTVGAWLKSVGDTVAFDDPLFEVSTDKVDSEIPSPHDGVLTEILVAGGETVPVGTVLARISSTGGEPATSTPPTPAVESPAAVTASIQTTSLRAGIDGAAGRPLSPVVRRLAAEHHLDLTAISGSGRGGRIMREDVLAAIGTGEARATPPPATPAPAAAPATPAPAAPAPAATTPHTAPPAPAAPAAAAAAGDEVVPLSRIRLITAERMVASKQISPHVWTSVEVDLEAVEQVRRRHKEKFRAEHGMSLTYLPFIARATCDALRAFPAVNSSVDLASKTMTLHRQVHLAVAVDLNEQGLMAPVVRDADALNLRELARGIRSVADAAKNGTLRSEQLSGSTFTITNPGPLGSFASVAIINQPNVAIMSTEGVARRPVVVGDAIAIHHTCMLGFSYDHRAFDGVTASRFLKYVRDALQDRDWEAELG